MIAITKVNVKNFKSLYDSSISLFGGVNLFYGFNNSGKSNIFKFLEILFKRKQVRSTIEVTNETSTGRQEITSESIYSTVPFYDGRIYDEPFLFSKNNRSVHVIFLVGVKVSNDLIADANKLKTSGFLGEDHTEVIMEGTIVSESNTTSRLRVQKASLNGKLFFEMKEDIEYYFEGAKGLTKKEGEAIFNLFNNLVTYIDTDRNFTKELIKENASNFDAKSFKNWLFELNMNAEKNHVFAELISFLSTFDFSKDAADLLLNNLKSFPFNETTTIGFSRFGQEIEVMLQNKNGRFPLKSFGTGIQQFFFILTKIFSSSSRIIIIEELELNLAPLYQKELLRFLTRLMPKKFDQLMFSSHSPFFTQKGYKMLDIIQHVRIGYINDGTTVDSYDDIEAVCGEDGISYFSLLYS